MWLYVLELEDNKFYVGKTTCTKNRFETHKKGNGCSWTRDYPPIRICEEYEIQDDGFEEDCKVKELMKKYGVENVRGGSYSSTKLSNFTVKLLTREIRHASDQCFTCGSSGHFAANCPKGKKYTDILKCPLCNKFAINCECNSIQVNIDINISTKIKKRMIYTRGHKRKTDYQRYFDKNYNTVADMIGSKNMIIINKTIAELWQSQKSKSLSQ
jgi:predicted GIY-YIG superfamily endonuclease